MKKVLLHACCAPCATHPGRVLAARGFEIVLYFYNPNLHPREEHDRRLAEALRWAAEEGFGILAPPPDFEAWEEAVRGLGDRPEGAERCDACIGFRLDRTAQTAWEGGFDAFASTLSVSPHKKAGPIARAGLRAAERWGVAFVDEDFKKKGGFAESVRLSKAHGLYRQDYCGCRWSLEAARKRANREAGKGKRKGKEKGKGK